MRSDIERGLSFSQAISKHPKVFPTVYIAMVRSGEVGGMLDMVLLQLASMLEKQLELAPAGEVGDVVSDRSRSHHRRHRLGDAAVHRADVRVDVQRPRRRVAVADRMLIALSGFLTSSWWLIVDLRAAAVVAALKRWRSDPRGSADLRRLKLRLPIIGPIVLKTAIARFCQTLAALARSGVSIMEALDIVADTAGNAVIAAAITDARERVRVGESVSVALMNHAVFPQMVVEMMAVGEETGALDEMLEKIGEFYDSEVSATVDSLTSLIEPLLMVVMGATVGAMVVSLYLPMFKIINLVK